MLMPYSDATVEAEARQFISANSHTQPIFYITPSKRTRLHTRTHVQEADAGTVPQAVPRTCSTQLRYAFLRKTSCHAAMKNVSERQGQRYIAEALRPASVLPAVI
jgi:hypothetical protein